MRLIGIYANTNDQIREQQWKTIENRTAVWGMNWMGAGDMNDILSNDEKWGGNLRGERSIRMFRSFVNKN